MSGGVDVDVHYHELDEWGDAVLAWKQTPLPTVEVDKGPWTSVVLTPEMRAVNEKLIRLRDRMGINWDVCDFTRFRYHITALIDQFGVERDGLFERIKAKDSSLPRPIQQAVNLACGEFGMEISGYEEEQQQAEQLARIMLSGLPEPTNPGTQGPEVLLHELRSRIDLQLAEKRFEDAVDSLWSMSVLCPGSIQPDGEDLERISRIRKREVELDRKAASGQFDLKVQNAFWFHYRILTFRMEMALDGPGTVAVLGKYIK